MTTPFTAEQSALALQRINEQKSKYREKYEDDQYWTDLAAVMGVRMPPWYTRPSDQDIKYWLKLTKVSYTQFVEAYGWKNCDDFERLNPGHGMKILAGLILELGQENARVKKLAKERATVMEVSPGNEKPPKQIMYKGKSKDRRRAELRAELAKSHL